MSLCFVPDFLVRRVTDIQPKFLKSKDVKLLLCDLDNTISLRHEKEPSEKIFEWKRKLEKAGIELMLFSNNRRGRAAVTAKQLGVR
ncbi:MAG: YqeG family HAD IIIA-type phosphatase, partial [Oscillospiraceae bacterium]|nr:YqeG family HAD IIIA-type phosphatase [Oscillospiraceae bacterium]